MKFKPVIIYIDDDFRSLVLFKNQMSKNWEILTYSNSLEVLRKLQEIEPWVILLDQNTKNMPAIDFLEIANNIVPHAVKIIVTKDSKKDIIIQLIKIAKIYDYIKKPWNPDDLENCLNKAIDYYRMITEKEKFLEKIKEKNYELEKRNYQLSKITNELKESKKSQNELFNEISSWVPAPLTKALKYKTISFPLKRDIVGVVFDIIGSTKLHNTYVYNLPVKTHILRLFTESIIRNGGLRESHAGDSAYAHFGAFNDLEDSFVSAIASAQEFRVALNSFSKINKVIVECGIALHFAPKTLFQMYEFTGETPHGIVKQKSYDSASKDIDLLHRIERLAHDLPGTNILMSKEFYTRLFDPPNTIKYLGKACFKGRYKKTEIYILPSYYTNSNILEKFKKNNNIF